MRSVEELFNQASSALAGARALMSRDPLAAVVELTKTASDVAALVRLAVAGVPVPASAVTEAPDRHATTPLSRPPQIGNPALTVAALDAALGPARTAELAAGHASRLTKLDYREWATLGLLIHMHDGRIEGPWARRMDPPRGVTHAELVRGWSNFSESTSHNVGRNLAGRVEHLVTMGLLQRVVTPEKCLVPTALSLAVNAALPGAIPLSPAGVTAAIPNWNFSTLAGTIARPLLEGISGLAETQLTTLRDLAVLSRTSTDEGWITTRGLGVPRAVAKKYQQLHGIGLVDKGKVEDDSFFRIRISEAGGVVLALIDSERH